GGGGVRVGGGGGGRGGGGGVGGRGEAVAALVGDHAEHVLAVEAAWTMIEHPAIELLGLREHAGAVEGQRLGEDRFQLGQRRRRRLARLGRERQLRPLRFRSLVVRHGSRSLSIGGGRA